MKINVINVESMLAKVQLEHNSETLLIPKPIKLDRDDQGRLALDYDSMVEVAEAIDMEWKIANTGAQMSVLMDVLKAIELYMGEE